MKLAVIDAHPPRWAAALVPFLEMLGYSRYWATEQHTKGQSGSPTLMAAAAGGRCKKMRVGTAGVMLKAYGPYKVLEDFKVLQLLYPGRVDMGFISAAPPEPAYSKLRHQSPSSECNTYADKVRLLVGLVRGEDAEVGDLLGATSSRAPEIWLCGCSTESARLAAELGVCYAYHDWRSVAGPGTSPGPRSFVDAKATGPVRAYFDEFRPHSSLLSPRLSVACYGICAETTAEAQALWDGTAGTDREGRRWPAGFCGSPEECREQLLATQDVYGAQEVVIQTMAGDLDTCMTSYSLLACACIR